MLALVLFCQQPWGAAAESAKAAETPADKTVSVSLEAADLRAVVTAIARASNINIVGSDRLTGAVTVRLNRAPALEALEVILKNAGFTLVKEDTGILQIVPLAEKLKAEAEKRTAQLKAEQVKQLAEQQARDRAKKATRIHVVPLKFADTERAAKLLVPSAIAKKENIAEDPASGQLIIIATADDIRNVEQVIKAIDTPPPQVAIQARIVEVYADRAKSLGLDFTVVSETSGPGGDGTATFTCDLSQATTAAKTLIFTFASEKVLATLNALVQKDAAEILSAPNVTTSHGKKATMKVVDQVPVITRTTRIVDQVTVTDEQVTFKETGVTLTVTPRVLADSKIAMVIEPSVQELTGWTATDPPAPIVDTRTATTEVTMTSGKWLVIGGLIRYNERKLERGIPVLRDIPGLGWLFRTTQTTRERTNLVILVSATVLNDEMIDKDIEDQSDRMRRHRESHDLEGIPLAPPGEARD